MTLREFIERAKEIADEAGEKSFSLQVEFWRYSSEREALTYEIWSASKRQNAEGITPEVALVNWQRLLSPQAGNMDALTDIEVKAISYGEGM